MKEQDDAASLMQVHVFAPDHALTDEYTGVGPLFVETRLNQPL